VMGDLDAAQDIKSIDVFPRSPREVAYVLGETGRRSVIVIPIAPELCFC
jgi:hypothetical protein